MRRDWLWGCAAVPSAFLVALILLGYVSPIVKSSEWSTLAFLNGFAAIVGTGVLWVANRRSVRNARRAGREIELLVRPISALVNTPLACLVLFGGAALIKFVLVGEFRDWQLYFVISGSLGYIWALMDTAYTSADAIEATSSA